jgi:site-specific recombinase XerD
MEEKMKSYKELCLMFENYLKGLGYANVSIRLNTYFIRMLFEYLTDKGSNDIREITFNDIKEFIESMQNKKTRSGKPFSKTTLYRMAGSIRHFFKYLCRNEIILFNPIEELPLKKEMSKRKEIFTQDEINNFLDCIINKRDRAIFELAYSSGLRISEIVNLNINDVDLKERILTIRQGKGSKDRYVPFNDVAEKFLQIYIKKGRKAKRNEKALFVTEKGRIKSATLTLWFRKYLKESGIKRKGLTPHSIRHSTGTHLLESGADVRYVQELLGHESIETTITYTHLMLDNLKKAYKSAHPRENKYYDEIDEEYLKNIDALIKEIKRREEINKRYPPSKYNSKRK